ncbi:MAG: DNA methyltransferase, partial [Chloroflexi bacterium]|nr:DNA methyltransferase [Chloroflexota bacterium]
LRVYLTNTLEEGFEGGKLPLAEWLAEEATAASKVKYDAPVMVVLGNPPYSGHSSNNSAWIADLLRGKDGQSEQTTGNYFMVDGQPLGERNPKWLNDDYVKFIRFAQWRIERTGYGILAFISNHGYLDNPTFRGMRQSLMQTFDDIYLLDLHGNSKKKERSPDGSSDENVFDIQQGVAIGIFVKRPGSNRDAQTATVRHAHFYGKREEKYHKLLEGDLGSTNWNILTPQTPFYLFAPQDISLRPEYEAGWYITNIFLNNAVGFQTHRDYLVISPSKKELLQRIEDFVNPTNSEEEIRQRYFGHIAAGKYPLGDTRDWKLGLSRQELQKAANGKLELWITKCIRRPFDFQWYFYHPSAIDYGRPTIMNQLIKYQNKALLWTRPMSPNYEFSVLTADCAVDQSVVGNKVAGAGGTYVGVLYSYPEETKNTLPGIEEKLPDTIGGRRPNLAPAFTTELAEKIGLKFIQDGKGDLQTTFGPEDLFHYIYAVFHSPTYRTRYAEFLKLDFPRVPLTSQLDLFRALCGLGEKLVALHLMEQAGPSFDTPAYPESGSNTVELVKYVEPITNGELQQPGRVYLNKQQYFEGVPPNVWGFHIGGYQVCEKWLKDRKGRTLTYDELNHYQGIVAALAETSRLMTAIDQAIGEQGGWPLQ